jgi:hypothetical protein
LAESFFLAMRRVLLRRNADLGQQVQFDVSLTQGEVFGRGSGAGQCTGGLARFPVTLVAQGRDSFVSGLAQVKAEALIRDIGFDVEKQEWSRQVNLVSLP